MTYSLDFRSHVLGVKAEEGLSFVATAKRFKIGKNSLFLWTKRLASKRTRVKPWTKIDSAVLKQDIKDYPDAYQYERAERLGVSATGILAALRRLKVSYKKNPDTPFSRRKITVIV